MIETPRNIVSIAYSARTVAIKFVAAYQRKSLTILDTAPVESKILLAALDNVEAAHLVQLVIVEYWDEALKGVTPVEGS